MTFDLTESEHQAFTEDGFVILRNRLPVAPRIQLLREFSRVVGLLANQWVAQGSLEDALDELPLTQRYLSMLSQVDAPVPAAWRRVLVSPAVYALWRRPELLDAVRSLLGEEVFAHGIWNGRPRDPFGRSSQVHWHQDAYYYKGWDPEQSPFVSCWIPLVPVTADTACLQFLRGSHSSGWLDRKRLSAGEFGTSVDPLNSLDIVTAEMQAGDVVFFTDTTVHRSAPNWGPGVRWSIDIRFARNIDEVVSRSPTGYVCNSSKPANIESFEVWARRYGYAPEELLKELTNFEEGYDLDALMAFSRKSPYSWVY